MAYDYNKSQALIIGMTDTDEKVTAASGRISTQEGTALSIWDKSQDKEKNANLIGKVTASGHTSTVEHTYFQLAFQNVTAVVEQFIIEFRLASYTVKSRRYVNFSDAGFYVPEFNNAEIIFTKRAASFADIVDTRLTYNRASKKITLHEIYAYASKFDQRAQFYTKGEGTCQEIKIDRKPLF